MRALLLLAAVSTALAQAPAKAVNSFSIEKEIELGEQLASAKQTSLQAQPDARLQAIGDKLTAKTDGPFEYHFFAFARAVPPPEPIALPGGPVFVARSMISADDAETAAIRAHAIAHIALRHYTRQRTQSELMEIGAKQNPLAVDEPVLGAMMMGKAQFGQAFELESDRLAVKLMIDAGYDPQALVRWLESRPVAKVNLALGDRPAPNRRVEAVQQAIKAAQ